MVFGNLGGTQFALQLCSARLTIWVRGCFVIVDRRAYKLILLALSELTAPQNCATCLVPPGAKASLDDYGNIVIDL